MIPNAFKAYRLDVKPSDIFHFGLAYVAQMKTKDSPDFQPMSEVAGAPQVNRGTSVLGFLLGSEMKTYLGAINECTWDLFNNVYLQAGRTWNVAKDFEVRGDVQFIDQRSVGSDLIGDFDTQLYGARLTASYRSAVLDFAFVRLTLVGLRWAQSHGW